MLRKGFSRFFLVLCLMIMSSMLFVACEKTKVKVSGVAYRETENITMIVGQTYTPDVSVTPSYASNRDYYFVAESNSDVIKISENSIIALKEGVAQLKVISSENEHLTDIIAVQVLPTAINLKSPTNLTFDGEKFSFSSVNYATNYYLSIKNSNTEKEIELGNSTSYSLSQYQNEFGVSPYNTVLEVKVKAVGDERITVASDYSDSISVLKISSPIDAKVEDNTLKFTKIKNVSKYELSFYTLNEELFILDVYASDFTGDEININISDYKDYFIGGQYFVSIGCSDEDYIKQGEEEVIASENIVIDFDVLTSPKNMVISNYVLYWDSVLGATSYTLLDSSNNVLQNNITVTNIDLLALGLTEGSYSYKLIANSNKNINVVSGMNESNVLFVKVLDKPTASIENKMITWTEVAGATAYNLVILKNGEVQNNLHLVGNSYSVANFTEGEYSFEVYSRGDNVTTLTSLESATGSFKVLGAVTNLRVENEQILWDSAEGEKFSLKVYDSTSTDAYIEEVVTTKSYDISNINFVAGEFTIFVETLGQDNVFNSKTVSAKFYKLSEVKEVNISNGVVQFSIDGRTVETDVVLKNVEDKTTIEALTASSKNKYVLDESKLGAGIYEIEVFAYGNNKNILDADNIADTRFLQIRKLDTATLKVDEVEFKVLKDKSVDYASNYELYMNGTKVNTFEASEDYKYDVSTITAGEYEFNIKALGNGADILDGEVGTKSVKILKLDTPKLSLNKTTLVYTITTNVAQDKYVSSYDFVVNDEPISATSKTIDCSEGIFEQAGSYEAKLRLVAGTSSDYDLIMNSDVTSSSATKINSVSSLTLNNGQILITPTNIGADGRHNYTATISIGYIEGGDTEYTYIEYKDAVYDSDLKGFVFNIYDENYNVTGPRKADGSYVFAGAGTYDFKLTLERSGYITSNTTSTGTITKLAQVNNIRKVSTANSNSNRAPSEKIAFDSVSGATKYLLRIVNKNVSYIAELESGSTSVTIDSIKSMFKKLETPLTINGGSTYNLEIIAFGDDANKVASSVVSTKFSMKLIKWPTLEINNHILYVTDTTVAEKVYVTCTDSNNTKYYKVLNIDNGETSLDLSKISGLASGDIKIGAMLESGNANTFESTSRTTNYTQLSQPLLSVSNGVITWEADDNARAYSLTYTINGETDTIELASGSENFSISDGVASYELKGIEVGTSTLALKKIGKGWVEDSEGKSVYYYDSVASSDVIITKLSQPVVEVKNGQIEVSLNATDYSNNYIGKVKINGVDITKYANFSQAMVIDGYELLNYTSETEIEEEIFTISIQANTVEGKYILNANDLAFGVKGLKPATTLAIKTDYDTTKEDVETIDSITWVPSTLNEGLISGYVIEIVYKNEIYTYTTSANQNSLTFPTNEKFGAGDYSIFVKTLTDTEGYVHSNLSDQLNVTVCEKPTKLRTNNGIVCWDKVKGANEYLVHLYDEEDELLNIIEVTNNEFDFESMRDYSAGVYKLKVFATNKTDNKIVSSVLSDSIELLRLPEITKYKVVMGELYLYTHTFTSKVNLTLTSKVDTTKVYNYSLALEPVMPNATNWSSISNLSELLTQEAEDEESIGWIYKKVEVDNGSELTSILNMLDARYSMQVKAIGNTTTVADGENVAVLSAINSKVTSNANNLTNEYVVEDENTDTNYVQKMAIVDISVSERGLVSFGLDLKYIDCNYYDLNGLLIYDVSLSVGDVDYSFFVVDNYYVGAIDETMVHVYDSTVENHTYYGYITYEYETDKYLYLNILRYKEKQDSEKYTGELEIDFTKDMLYFVNKSGITEEIDLKKGGNFEVNVKTVGDNTVYLTSNVSSNISVVRYEQLDLNIDDGYLTWKNLKVEDDDPIYLLKVTNSSGETTLVYLYDKESTIDESVLPEIIENRTYFEAIDTTSEVIKYMLDTIYSENYVFDAGSYSVNITTYYRDSTDNSRLESRASADLKVEKLERASLSVNSGLLKWNLIKVGSENILDYQIFLSGGNLSEDITFKISENDYTVSSGVISYLLPQNITDINGEEYVLDYSANAYQICLRTVEDARYINSNNSEVLEFTISDYVTDLRMENGKVVWNWGDENTESLYELKIEVYKKDGTKFTTCIVTNVSVKSYDLESSRIDISGQKIELTSNYLYKIYVKRTGDNSSLTGFYKDCVEAEKLKAVTDSSISTTNGVLTWDAITSLSGQVLTDVNYVIEFVGTELDDYVAEGKTEFDFAGFDAGEYTVKITPKTNSHFTGVTSSEFTVYKLNKVGQVSNPKINDVYNILQWNAVYVTVDGEKVYADRYEIEISNTDGEILLTDNIDDAEKTGVIQYSLESESVSDINVRVKAVMTSSGKLINAEWSDTTSFTRANAIDSEYFVVNEDKIRFEWRAIEGEQTGDRYILRFSYKESASSTSSSVTRSLEISSYEEVNGIKTYYFIPDKIGYYTEISVTVNRGSSLSSERIVMTVKVGESEEIASYTFDKFASGEGTESNPFVIETVAQLQNINIFPNKYYLLNNDLDMTGINEIVIKEEFRGTFNGGGFTIEHYTLTSEEFVVGMFRSLNGANIYDLNIAYANINMTTNYNGEKVYGGVLAGIATNSTITNVNVTYSLMNITCSDTSTLTDTTNSKFYYGGLIGYLDNCTITNCSVELGYKDENSSNNYSSLTFTGWNGDNVYFGGVTGYALNTTIVGSEQLSSVAVYYQLSVNQRQGVKYYPVINVGGVVGAMEGSNISKLSVELHQSGSWNGELSSHGGVAGYIYSVNGLTTFSNINVSGAIYNDMCSETKELYSGTDVASSADVNITSENITSTLEIGNAPN